MVGKKGFLRIVEATIAILIILGALLVISSQREVNTGADLTGTLRRLLEEIAKNQDLRNQITSYDLANCETSYEVCRTEPPNKEVLGNISEFLDERINPAFDYSISICNAENICYFQESYPDAQEIYAAERIITSSLGGNDSDDILRKIKIFLWRRV